MKSLVRFTKVTIVLSIIYMLLTSCEDMMGNYLEKTIGSGHKDVRCKMCISRVVEGYVRDVFL